MKEEPGKKYEVHPFVSPHTLPTPQFVRQVKYCACGNDLYCCINLEAFGQAPYPAVFG